MTIASLVHEEIEPDPIDGSENISPTCQLASPVEEDTPTSHEDNQTMLGKRPVHESVDGLPLMQIIADLVHSYIQRAIAIPMCMSLSMVCR